MSLADLQHAPGTRVRLGIAGLIDGRTQWSPLSAAVDHRSNAEPHTGPGSIVGRLRRPIARFSTFCNAYEQMTRATSPQGLGAGVKHAIQSHYEYHTTARRGNRLSQPSTVEGLASKIKTPHPTTHVLYGYDGVCRHSTGLCDPYPQIHSRTPPPSVLHASEMAHTQLMRQRPQPQRLNVPRQWPWLLWGFVEGCFKTSSTARSSVTSIDV